MLKHAAQVIVLSFACVFTSLAPADTTDTAITTKDIDTQAKLLSSQAQNLNPQVVKLGLEAYLKARSQGYDPQQLLTIVDYSLPSTERRFWVFDMKNDNMLYQELVAHGRNSGDNIADAFSDTPSSRESSVGLFLTANTYLGHHGYSLKLQGLEKGYNDTAEAREVVVHAADYVSDSFAAVHGRLGRSFGCFALNTSVAQSVISTIKDGTLIFAYGHDQSWLQNSKYLS